MLEFIGEIIISFFVEVIFKGIIIRILTLIYLFGILFLKLLTFSRKPIADLKEKYKDSSKPYFIGFSFLFGIVYLITIL